MFGDADPRVHVQAVSHTLLLSRGDDSPNPCSIAFIWRSNANDMPQEWLNVFSNIFFRKPTLTHTLPLKSLVLDSGLRRSQDLISVPSQITYTLLGLDKSNASGNPLLIDILDNDVKLNETCASKHINSFFWFCSVTSLKSGIKSRNYTRAFWLNGYFFALSGCSV